MFFGMLWVYTKFFKFNWLVVLQNYHIHIISRYVHISVTHTYHSNYISTKCSYNLIHKTYFTNKMCPLSVQHVKIRSEQLHFR